MDYKPNWEKVWEDKATTQYTKHDGMNRIYIYNKGWFRGEEKKYVVSTFYKTARKNKAFSTKSEAMAYARAYMRRN